jgi:hypothetical protein
MISGNEHHLSGVITDTAKEGSGNYRCVKTSAQLKNGDGYSRGTTETLTEVAAGYYGGLFISRDRGATWDSVTIDDQKLSFRDIAVCGDTLYGVDYGICISIDNGTSWRSIFSIPEDQVLFPKDLNTVPHFLSGIRHRLKIYLYLLRIFIVNSVHIIEKVLPAVRSERFDLI